MGESHPELERLPRGMRAAMAEALEPSERIVAVWTTRGLGANALVCTPRRALIAKRAELINWSVAAFSYSEIASVEVIDGRPGAAAQMVLTAATSAALDARQSRDPFHDFPDAYFQESRRLLAPNTLMFRSRGTAREAAEILERLIAEPWRA